MFNSFNSTKERKKRHVLSTGPDSHRTWRGWWQQENSKRDPQKDREKRRSLYHAVSSFTPRFARSLEDFWLIYTKVQFPDSSLLIRGLLWSATVFPEAALVRAWPLDKWILPHTILIKQKQKVRCSQTQCTLLAPLFTSDFEKLEKG